MCGTVRWFIPVLLGVILWLPGLRPILAVETVPSGETDQEVLSYGPYCGLFCLYAAMKSQGAELDFNSLVRPEYCSSYEGSSLAELESAVRDHGFHALTLRNMTPSLLMRLDLPAVLHVKSSPKGQSYDHFVLFLGMEGQRARILDPPGEVRLLNMAEISMIWDGLGMVVGRKPMAAALYLAPIRYRNLFWVVLGVGVIWATRVGFRRSGTPGILAGRPYRQSAMVALLIAGFSGVAGLVYHMVNPVGMFHGLDHLSAIHKVHGVRFLAIAKLEEVRQGLKAGYLLVDARMPGDYLEGHIERAVNIPPDGGRDQRRKAVGNYPKTKPVIVYCQSPACDYDEGVAAGLLEDGFTDVRLFKGGWEEWK